MKLHILFSSILLQSVLLIKGWDIKCLSEVGFYSNPLNCNEYFYCENWKAVVKKCPAGFHFNPHFAVCDDPLTADCPKVCKEPTGLFPDPDDCNKYYQCVDDVASLRDCPEGYHFNAKISVCDYPLDAGCA